MATLPFTVRDLLAGFAAAHGLLSLEDDFLRVQATVELAGFLRSRSCDLRISLARIEEVAFRPGWFRGELVIRARDLHALSAIPGAAHTRLVVSVEKRDFAAATEFASDARLRLAELRLLRRHAAAGRRGVMAAAG